MPKTDIQRQIEMALAKHAKEVKEENELLQELKRKEDAEPKDKAAEIEVIKKRLRKQLALLARKCDSLQHRRDILKGIIAELRQSVKWLDKEIRASKIPVGNVDLSEDCPIPKDVMNTVYSSWDDNLND